jgi:hypothetical protein
MYVLRGVSALQTVFAESETRRNEQTLAAGDSFQIGLGEFILHLGVQFQVRRRFLFNLLFAIFHCVTLLCSTCATQEKTNEKVVFLGISCHSKTLASRFSLPTGSGPDNGQ